jgi:two-component system phosphate regulon sensor histidine kinase PhoR
VKLGIRAKLFLVSLGLMAVAAVVADLYLTARLDELITDRIRDDLYGRARLVAHAAAALPENSGRWDALADELGVVAEARVTLIRADGVVLGDSEVAAGELGRLENHRDRKEIQDALETGRGVSVRESATVHRRLMYVAIPFRNSRGLRGTARLAMPLTQVELAISRLRQIFLGAAILALGLAILMSGLAAHLVSRSVRRLTGSAQAMAEGDLDARVAVAGDDEIALLGRALDRLASSLSRTLGELRSERDLLGRILSGMEEGVVLLDQDLRIALVNPALREMLFLDAEVVGKPLLEVLRNAELKAIFERARESTAGRPPPTEVELSGIKPRRVLVHAASLQDEPGRILAVLVDVTQLRQLETMRRDFVANVSHELRTPITAALTAAETLRPTLAEPETAIRFIEIIERNMNRLRELVEDLLDLSRIESREFRLASEPIELRPWIEQLLFHHRDRASEKKIAIASEIPEDLPPARADRRALDQALGNLVDNAIKYCPEGARITIAAREAGGLLHLEVRDNGRGIAAEHLPRLFERFYRVDPGRSRAVGGTGLGLAIVRHLAEAMGGSVEVESELGKGTVFTLAIPSVHG